MANLGGPKTPITLLYEYAIVRRLSPRFEVIDVKFIDRKPVFTVSVTVGSLCEEACALSKKVAKHNAATKMLKRLNIESDGTEDGSYDMEELTDAQVNQNYVGNLKIYCLQNRYPEAKYDLEEEDGPPHRKVFKMICSVSQLQEFGISRTKKLAKQKAAYKMIIRLKKIHGDPDCKEDEFEDEEEVDMDNYVSGGQTNLPEVLKLPEVRLTDDEIFEKYKSAAPGQASSAPITTHDPVAYYRDHYKAYVNLNEISPTISNITKGNIQPNCDNALNLINDIASELRVSLTFTEVDAAKNDGTYILIGMSVVPSLCGIGKNKDFAALNLLESIHVLCTE